MSVGGGSEKGTSKTEPWDQQKPYLIKAFQEADRLYGGDPATQAGNQPAGATATAPAGGNGGMVNAGSTLFPRMVPAPSPAGSTSSTPRTADGVGGMVPAYYEGNTVAGLSGQTMQAAENYARMAGGTPGMNSAINETGRTTEGFYLNGDGAFQHGNNVSNDLYSDFATGSNLPSMLTTRTAGGYFLNDNPYLSDMASNANRSAIEQYTNLVTNTPT